MRLNNIFHGISDQVRNLGQANTFARNVSIVFGGNVVNLIIQFGLTPVISRIFGPEAYGQYAYYSLIISNIIFYSSLSLPTVYLLPKDHLSFLGLGKVVFHLVLIGSLGFVLVALIVKESFPIDRVTSVVACLFIILLVSPLNNILEAWNTRKKKFAINSRTSVLSNIVSKAVVLGVGALGLNVGLGLLLGDLSRGIVSHFMLAGRKVHWIVYRFLIRRNWKFVYKVFKENDHVPKYMFPGQAASKLSADIPILIIGGAFGKFILGNYTFALSLLNIPIRLITNSISTVFFQKASELYHDDKEKLKDFLFGPYFVLLAVYAVPSLVFIFYSETIFLWVFGDNWSKAGSFSGILTIHYFFHAVSSSFGPLRRVFRQSSRILSLSLISIAFKLWPFLLLLMDLSFERILLIYSISQAVFIIINYSDMIYWEVSKKKGITLYLSNAILLMAMVVIVVLKNGIL